MAAEHAFRAALLAGQQVPFRYEDARLLEQAVAVIPLDDIANRTQARIDSSLGALSEEDFADVQVLELLRWFKRDFFKWVDKPACSRRGNHETIPVRERIPELSRPNAEEAAGLARRVELFKCSLCQNVTRFPRFNDPGVLLRTRRGRCGEWANCFGLLLRVRASSSMSFSLLTSLSFSQALGHEVRWVRDWSDHVWVEVWSSRLGGRFVHCDPCEEAYDKPLLYSCGWNKRLNYVLAFGRHGVTDVTKRYVPCPWDETLARRSLVRESWLSSMCELLSSQCTALMFDSEERNLWTSRNAEELQGLRRSSGASASDRTGLSGRQSGSESWRRERGEIGQAKRNLYKLRNFVLTFSGENSPEENAYCLFDRRNDTKWLDFSFKTRGEAFIGLEFEDPKVLKSYELGKHEARKV